MRTDLDLSTATEVATLPYVLRHGTREMRSKREITRRLESLYGASIGVDVLKLGEQHILTFGLQVLGDRYLPEGSQVFSRGLRLLAAMCLDPALDEGGALRAAEVGQEKEKLRRFVEGLINDKGTYAAQRCLKAMCGTEPYGVFEYGRVEDLPALDGAKLEARRSALLTNAALDIYVVGAIDPGKAKRLVEAEFALQRPAPAALRGTTEHPPATAARELREDLEGLSQSKLVMGFRSEIRLADEAFWSMLLMHGVLGGFPHSKLFRNVREKAGLCYDASSSIERFKGLLFIFAGIDADKFEQTRDLCLEQLEALRRGEISEQELESTRLGFRQAYRSLLDSPTRMLNLDYLMGMGGRSSVPGDLIAAVDEVTAESIQSAAKRMRLDTVYFLEPRNEAE